MRRSLLQTLTASDKRKEILFFLRNSHKTLSDIVDFANVKKSSEVSPRLKEMEVWGLISKNDGIYTLTPLGEVLLIYYEPLLDTISAMESNCGYWTDHDISGIPNELLIKIKDLKDGRIVSLATHEVGESHPEFIDNVKKSLSIKGAACTFIPSWISLFLECARRGAKIDIIITPGVHNKIKREFAFELETLLKYDARVYICADLNISFASTERFFSMSLGYISVKHHDTRNDLIGFDSSSIKWGEDLFEYYKEKSIEIRGTAPINEAITQHFQVPLV